MTYILGIDVSRNQGPMDFARAFAAGAQFVFIRAGSVDSRLNVCYTDSQFLRSAAEAPKYLLTGTYWFFRASLDPKKQAEYYARLLEGRNFHLPPVIDVELAGYSQAVMQKAVKTFLDVLEVIAERRPMIYTRGEFWNTKIGNPVWAKGYKLWIARYIKQAHPWKNAAGKVEASVKPNTWDDWLFWQHSADENRRAREFGSPAVGGSHAIDLNWFNGSETDLLAFANIQPVPAPVPEPAPTPEPVPAAGWKESVTVWARTVKPPYTGPNP